ncbi:MULTISPECIES: hypothetical protein [Brenneria]|uniref:Uncharacterized protein n=1 Tax=Brenneria tiliae TaxID=2914984 RepID=A0ABT0MX57_9GAMM|nr:MULTISPECIES: hypothetical protein [Brenneria]MCL2894426.1 hypothetical protein [Brenneria tiliae]MCL2897319.1 hypothetical protein [Brenneria tiliae]MCL2901738.1 hypothetical protein [Brenneria tiliae]
MAESDPKEVTVSDGLAKMREAADKLTEEELEALAEEAKKAVEESREEAAKKR